MREEGGEKKEEHEGKAGKKERKGRRGMEEKVMWNTQMVKRREEG